MDKDDVRSGVPRVIRYLNVEAAAMRHMADPKSMWRRTSSRWTNSCRHVCTSFCNGYQTPSAGDGCLQSQGLPKWFISRKGGALLVKMIETGIAAELLKQGNLIKVRFICMTGSIIIF